MASHQYDLLLSFFFFSFYYNNVKDTEGSGSISMIANASLLPRVNKEIAFIASWAKTLLFSLSVMLGLYVSYY